jgi:hypothetical protein
MWHESATFSSNVAQVSIMIARDTADHPSAANSGAASADSESALRLGVESDSEPAADGPESRTCQCSHCPAQRLGMSSLPPISSSSSPLE